MRSHIAAMVALPALLGLAGCATYGPTWSEVTGERYNVTIQNRRPAVIERIDGYSSYASYPIKIDPGKHDLVLGGPAPAWQPGGAPLHAMALDFEPCMRYYLNAQFDNKVQPNWEPVIDFVEPIAGCRTVTAAR